MLAYEYALFRTFLLTGFRGTRNCRCNARGSFAQLFSRGEDRGSESSCDTPRMSVVALPDLNVLPAEALRALILAQHPEQLLSRESEIAHLKLLSAKLQRMQFGRKSEKLQRQIEQLELRLEELQANREETNPAESPTATPPILITAPAGKPARRALPEHLPRETET